jgi:DNA repair ATPase RecN
MVKTLPLSLYPELKDIDPSLIDEHVIAQIEAQRTAESRVTTETGLAHEIYQAIEEDNIDTISFLGQNIGTMMKVRERFGSNREIKERAEYFIRIFQAELEEIAEEIENDRRTLKEIEGI